MLRIHLLQQWYYRFVEGYAYVMKVHAGVDKDSGLIYLVVVTAAKVHDFTPVAELLHGDGDVVCGDAGYQGIANTAGKRRALPDTPEGKLQDLIEAAIAGMASACSSSRACQGRAPIPGDLDEVGRRPKQQFGFQKTRLRGLAKNRCKINVLAALTNLFLVRRHLLATA